MMSYRLLNINMSPCLWVCLWSWIRAFFARHLQNRTLPLALFDLWPNSNLWTLNRGLEPWKFLLTVPTFQLNTFNNTLIDVRTQTFPLRAWKVLISADAVSTVGGNCVPIQPQEAYLSPSWLSKCTMQSRVWIGNQTQLQVTLKRLLQLYLLKRALSLYTDYKSPLCIKW